MAAEIPAELREAAGRAAHAATPGPRLNWACATGDASCVAIHANPAEWHLTDAQREAFRASQDAGLSVVWPVLAECRRLFTQVTPTLCGWAADGSDRTVPLARRLDAVAARLAALGVK